MLNFSFTTNDNGAGSFTLNTSISDSDPSPIFGIFENAITDFTYTSDFGERSNMGPLDLMSNNDAPPDDLDQNVTFSFGLLDDFGIGFTLGFAIPNASPNNLSSNPADYEQLIKAANSVALLVDGTVGPPGSGQGFFDEFTVITQQEPMPVPEPKGSLGMVGGLVILGLGLLKMKVSDLGTPRATTSAIAALLA